VRKMFYIFCLFMSMGASLPAHAADTPVSCRQFVEAMSKRAEIIFHDTTMDFMQKRSVLSGLFEGGVDIAWVAQNVAGSFWKTANEKERADYVKAYRAYLSNKYVGALDEDDINGFDKFTLVDFAAAPSNAYHAHLEITQKSDQPISVDLRMEQSSKGACRVHDFTLEGVSLLKSQADQIQTLAASGGLKYVTQKLVALVPDAREKSM